MNEVKKSVWITLVLSILTVGFLFVLHSRDNFRGLFSKCLDVDDEFNLIKNGDFEDQQFGYVENWADVFGKPVNQWLLRRKTGNEGSEIFVGFINLQEYSQVDGCGYGIISVDRQTCSGFCSSEAVQLVPAEAGVSYELSADGYVLQGGSGSLYLDFLSRDRARIAIETKGGFVKDQWTRKSVEGVAPPGTYYIRVILYTSNKFYGTMLWDNVMLRAVE